MFSPQQKFPPILDATFTWLRSVFFTSSFNWLVPIVSLISLVVCLLWQGFTLGAMLKHATVVFLLASAMMLALHDRRLHLPFSAHQMLAMSLIPYALTSIVYIPFLLVLNVRNHPASLWTPLLMALLAMLSNITARATLRKEAKSLWQAIAQRVQLLFGKTQKSPLILVGQAHEVAWAIRGMHHFNLPYTCQAIIENSVSSTNHLHDHAQKGNRIQGVRILGTLDKLETILQQTQALQGSAFLILPSVIEHPQRHSVISYLRHFSSQFLILQQTTTEAPPTLSPLTIESIFRLDIPQEIPQGDISAMVRLRTVMITGAGGYLGRNLARRIAAMGPARLILIDCHQSNLLVLAQDISQNYPNIYLRPFIMDVRNRRGIDWVVDQFAPDIVFHLAANAYHAYHDLYPHDTLATALLGTFHVAEACRRNRVQVMISASVEPTQSHTYSLGQAMEKIHEIINQCFDKIDSSFNLTRYIPLRLPFILGTPGADLGDSSQTSKSSGHTIPNDLHHECVRILTRDDAVTLLLHSLANIEEEGQGYIYHTTAGDRVTRSNLARLTTALESEDPYSLFKEDYDHSPSLTPFTASDIQDNLATSSPFIMASTTYLPDFESLLRGLNEFKRGYQNGDLSMMIKAIDHLAPGFLIASDHSNVHQHTSTSVA